MIALFYGKDDFSSHEALDALRSELDTDGLLIDNTTHFDGASVRPDDLLMACQTMPLLGGNRMIIVTGLLARFESARRPRRSRAKAGNQPESSGLGDWQAFSDALATLPESTTLVFVEGDLKAQNAFLKALPKGATIRQFEPLRQAEVAAWIGRRAQERGVALEGRATAALAGLVGNQLWTLDSELQKLGTFAGDRPVTEDDVRSMVSLAREPSVFAMADAVIEGRVQDAMVLLQRLQDQGDTPQRLLAMVARQYRLLLLAKELLEQRVRGPEIATRLGVPNFVLQTLLKQAPAYTLERLRRAYRKLLEADLNVKRGIYDDETALQLLFFELSALAKSGGAPTPGGRPGYNRPPGGQGRARSGAATGSSGTS
ncbi:MAG: DNA polymerase III subunit delta [Dehalococcoidia bacterium]